MPIAEINDVTYAYDIEGSGPPVLLLHGFTGSRANWREAVPNLSREFQVLTVDLLGHGETDAPAEPGRYRIESAAADLATLLEFLHLEAVQILGYSMGGRLALFTALSYPEKIRSVTIESGSPGLAIESAREQRRELDEALADRIEREGIGAFVDYWESLPLWESQALLSPAEKAILRSQRLNNRPTGLSNSLRGMGTGAQPSLWGRLAALQPPALLISGEFDPKYLAINKQMAALIPQCEFKIVPDAGHTVHLEKPKNFWAVVCGFWRQEPSFGP